MEINNQTPSTFNFQPLQDELKEAIKNALVENDWLLCIIMADQLMNVLINNTFQSQIEEMVNNKIKAQVDHYENEIRNIKQQIEAEQYRTQDETASSFMVSSVASKREENTDEVVKTFISQQLEFEIDDKDIPCHKAKTFSKTQ